MNNITEIIENQREFFKSGATLDIEERIETLKKLKAAIQQNEQLLIDALKKDLGKCETESFMTEIGICYSEIEYMIKNLKRLAKPRKVKTPKAYFGNTSKIMPEPLGLSLIIVPWNYPVLLAISPLAGSIAAGNCVIIKVSSNAKATASALQHIINGTFSNEYIYVPDSVPGSSSAILKENFDHIFFTGSPSTGKKVMAAAAEHLTPVVLELGGKSPCIVASDANIDDAAKRICFGKFTNAGQTCVAPDYVIVHKSVHDDLIEALTKNLKEFYGKNPEESSDFGRIINERQFDRITGLLKDRTIIHGGNNTRSKLYIEPTLVDCYTTEDLESPLMNEEIFGPVLPIITYSHIDDAIDFINSKPKPLALYVFTKEKLISERVLQNTSSGGACINDVLIHMTSSSLPFGGVGGSGMGNYHGDRSFETFSHFKSVMEDFSKIDTKVYPPYRTPIALIKKLMKFL